jgi:mono/diheme cytochrome c family protein
MKSLIVLLSVSIVSCVALDKRLSRSKSSNGGPNSGANADTTSTYAKDYERDAALEAKALAILKGKCEGCHSPTNSQGGFGSVANIDAMIGSGKYLIPGKPDSSLIYTRLNPKVSNFMPPSAALSTSEIETVKNWIAGFKRKAGTVVKMSMDEVLDVVKKDFDANVGGKLQKNIRYITFHTMAAEGWTDADLDNARQALSKVYNSLSNSSQVVKPKAIDKNKLIYRINLDEIDMDRQDFEDVMEDTYVYWVEFKDNKNFDDLKDDIGDDNFLLRADWFIATAMQPNLYKDLMDLDDLKELEDDIDIDLKDNIEDKKIMRSGFKKSGVSAFNRVLERQETDNGRYFWISYDFADAEDEQNIFENPFGPDFADLDAGEQFKEDGGEIIWQLPNGFLAFFLIDAQGIYLDKGPTTIVQNTNGPAPYLNAIVNANSCLDCHRKGLLDKNDELRSFVKVEKDFSQDDLDLAREIYVDKGVFTKQIQADTNSYIAALKEAGIDPNAEEEHVKAVTLRFYEDLSFDKTMAELGTTKAELEKLLTKKPFQDDWAGLRQKNGTITREDFNERFGDAVEELDKDQEYKSPRKGDFLVTTSCMVVDLFSMEACFVKR